MESIKEISLQLNNVCNLKCKYCFATPQSVAGASFEMYKELINFVKTLPLKDNLSFTYCGGEPSLVNDQIRIAHKNLSKLNRDLDIKLKFGMYTNGTNLCTALEKNVMNGYLNPEICSVSWDGCHTTSRSRYSRFGNRFNDYYYICQITSLGLSGLGNDVLVRTALTPDTIDDMHDSVKFLLECGCYKWEYYYLMDCEDYRDEKFIEKFKVEMQKIIDLENFDKNFEFYNHQRFIEDMKKENRTKHLGCGTLGQTLYISSNGDVFPCGFFSDDCKYGNIKRLGNIRDPFDQKKMDTFISEYKELTMCNYKECGNFQCFECPGTVSSRPGDTEEYKATQVCKLRTAERELFLSNYISK